jgi:lysophospholipase L1-like esterase
MRILVVGDSYANFGRFESGIVESFAVRGVDVDVTSFSRSGFTTSQLCKAIQREILSLAKQGPFTFVVIVAGVNDVVQRRGARRYARDTGKLIRLLSPIAQSIQVMQIARFNEFADLSRLPGRIKHRCHALVRDRAAGRIERYSAAAEEMACARILRTDDLLPHYDSSWFKDGIHLTDARFAELARHIGNQLAEMAVINQDVTLNFPPAGTRSGLR